MRSRFQQRLHDESGVVAIIVALSMSTFLLGFAALAVDAGVAFATKAQLQSVADRLAVGTASALPDATAATAAFEESFRAACQDTGLELWGGGPCTIGASFDWASDGNRDNGEVEFLRPTSDDAPLRFVLPEVPAATPVNPTAVRVSLPPATVKFGFGSFFGIDHVDVQKFATARIGSSLAAGMLPFAATQTDIRSGQFCVVDPDVPPATPTGSTKGTSPSSPPGLAIDRPNPATVDYDPDAGAGAVTPVTFSLVLNFPYLQAKELSVKYATSTGSIAVDNASVQILRPRRGVISYQFTVDVPNADPGVNLELWVVGKQRRLGSAAFENFVSASASLGFAGRPADDQDPCSLPQAKSRGFVDLARKSGLNALEDNVRRGPQVQLYPSTLLDPVLNAVGDLCVQKIFQPKTSCVTSNGTPGFNTALSAGLFADRDGVDGRLKGNCGQGTTSSGGTGGVDASRLVGAAAGPGLLDTRAAEGFGTGAQLRRALVSGAAPPATRGWIGGTALRCPRMAVLPVVSNTPSALDVVLSGGQEITGFVYLWIDGIDASRGLSWNGGRLRSVSGYVIDPRYLPAVVAGSGLVGPFLGGTMPKEATLICDLADQKLGRCADAA